MDWDIPIWHKVVPDGTEQSQVGQNGPRWDRIVPDGIEMSKIGQKAYSFSKMFSEIRQNDSKAKEKEKKTKKNKKTKKTKKEKCYCQDSNS